MDKMCVVVLCGLLISGCSGNPPGHLGAINKKFAPCPEKPNCVNSQSNNKDHHIEPLTYNGSREDAAKKLKQVILSMERARIVEYNGDYIWVEFKSALWRFVDDVEFCFSDDPIIHIKSASRTGHSDFGVNRKRVTRIRELFNEK
jgi:uncharacterized protein (DUF1499 family)